MADKNLKNPENVIGRFYVDNTCIDCDICRSTAPKFFKRCDEGGYSYVYCQPQSAEEIAQAEEARESCPTESIGNDGESQTEIPGRAADNSPGQARLWER